MIAVKHWNGIVRKNSHNTKESFNESVEVMTINAVFSPFGDSVSQSPLIYVFTIIYSQIGAEIAGNSNGTIQFFVEEFYISKTSW